MSLLSLAGAGLGAFGAVVQPVLSGIALVCGAVLGVAGVWRLVRQALRGRTEGGDEEVSDEAGGHLKHHHWPGLPAGTASGQSLNEPRTLTIIIASALTQTEDPPAFRAGPR